MQSSGSKRKNPQDPFDLDQLRCLLAGTSNNAKPRAKTATNVWRKEAAIREAIEKRTQEMAAAQGKQRKDFAAIRDSIARSMFKELPAEERALWEQKAKAEHKETLEKWEKSSTEHNYEDPAYRQRCLANLPDIAQIIVNAVSEATGWQAAIIGGGPNPKQGGRISIVSRESKTDDMDVGRSEREQYKKELVSLFSSFLRQSYTAEDCQKSALDTVDGLSYEEIIDMNGIPLEDANKVEIDEPLPQPLLQTSSTPATESESLESTVVSAPSLSQSHNTTPSPASPINDCQFQASLPTASASPISSTAVHANGSSSTGTPAPSMTPHANGGNDVVVGTPTLTMTSHGEALETPAEAIQPPVATEDISPISGVVNSPSFDAPSPVTSGIPTDMFPPIPTSNIRSTRDASPDLVQDAALGSPLARVTSSKNIGFDAAPVAKNLHAAEGTQGVGKKRKHRGSVSGEATVSPHNPPKSKQRKITP